MPGAHGGFDIGNGGLWGFDRPPMGQDVERAYLDGGHSAGVADRNLQHLVDFILAQPGTPRHELIADVPEWTRILSNLAWAVWLGILIGLAVLFYTLPPFGVLALAIFLVLVLATV